MVLADNAEKEWLNEEWCGMSISVLLGRSNDKYKIKRKEILCIEPYFERGLTGTLNQ